ncbi:hypothetical protein [uncultured Pseudomonas sp.]|uniref:hypothetical protein n=1 Tax=uncultured Pseudomonas sp. TaxID=114707 RepID=UPI0025E98079|nr:hypothetical protein [uncultured Pseudomonas sp.]
MQTRNDILSGNSNVITTSWTQPSSRSPQESEDANFFTSQMERAPLAVNAAAPGSTPNILADASTSLIRATNRMGKGLKAFNTSDSEKEKLNYSTELSNTMLLTQVLTKGVGKTVQLVEKITNLQ